jgi:hypothetical protein
MVSKNIIENVINKSINDIEKCKATENAKKIGASCNITIENENNDDYYNFSYEDGTSMKFDKDYNLININFDGENYDYYGEDKCYDEFDYQKRRLISNQNEDSNDYESLLNYADDFATVNAWVLNTILRDDNVEESDYIAYQDTLTFKNNEWFNNLEKNTPADHDNYCAVRITSKIHDNEDLSKRIITDKGHYSTSVGADMDSLINTFGNGKRRYGDDYFDKSWKTITLIKKDSGVTGLFLGTALNEGRYANSTYESDYESELNFPQNSKFERLIIDEKNKIILQVPKV